jgi:hypothetical protein
MSDFGDDSRRRFIDRPELRDLIREMQELNRRVTILETKLELNLQQVSRELADLRTDVAGCATKEQLKPAVWLLGILGSSGIGAFVLTLWNLILKKGGNP